MALKRVYEAQDQIPTEHVGLYVERDGRFVLDLDGEGGDDLATLRRTVEHERRQRKQAIEAKAALEAELTELRTKAPPPDGKPDAQQQAQATAYEKRIEALEKTIKAEQERRDAAERRLADTRITEDLRREAIALGVLPEFVADLVQLPRVRQPLRLTDTGDTAVFEGNELRYSETEPGKPMGPREHLKAILKDQKHYFAPSSGAGAAGSAGTPRTNGSQFVLSRAEARDAARYSAAKAAADKAGQELVIAAE